MSRGRESVVLYTLTFTSTQYFNAAYSYYYNFEYTKHNNKGILILFTRFLPFVITNCLLISLSDI